MTPYQNNPRGVMVAMMTPHQKTRLVLAASGGGNDDTPSKKPAWY
jgi:hypothetical protein